MHDLNELLSRIQTDYEFYLEFERNPQQTLKRFELSAEEKAALTESAGQFSSTLGTIMPGLNPFAATTQTSCTQIRESRLAEPEFTPTTQTALARIAESEFDPTTALKRSEVNETIAEILAANADADRLAPMLALMEEIG
jgi:hypothetical protein